jgi:Zn-dependent protease
LFNLIPLTPLDGGRICAALSPWLWIPGLFTLIWWMFQRQSVNFVCVLILIAALPKIWSLFWSKTDEQKRYYEVQPVYRFMIAVCYFGLAGLLFFQKEEAMSVLQGLGHWRS